MKKVLTLVLISALLAGTTACSKNTNDMNAQQTDTEQVQTTFQNEQDTLPITDNTSESNGSMTTGEYNTIINMYSEIVSTHQNPSEGHKTSNYDASWKWYNEIFNATLIGNVSQNSYGYAYLDLNNDNEEELILLLEDHTILAIFSMVDGAPFMLSDFHSRKTCWIDNDQTIHISGSNGADVWSYSEYKLSSDGTELNLLFEYGSEGYDQENNKNIYYMISNSVKAYMSDQQFTELCASKPYSSLSDAAENTKHHANLIFNPLPNE